MMSLTAVYSTLKPSKAFCRMLTLTGSPRRPPMFCWSAMGTTIFKIISGGSGPNYIPPFLGEFDPWIGETAADNRYVTVSGGDTLPDMYIGRLPVNSAAETTAMVTKIMAYEQDPLQGDWNTRLTFVADNADSGGNFPVLSDAIADHSCRLHFTLKRSTTAFPLYHSGIRSADRTSRLRSIRVG